MDEITDVTEGRIVWAKLKSYDWWPGMIVPSSLCKPMIGHKDVHYCLYWYGHNSISAVEHSLKMCDFIKVFKKCNRRNRTKAFKYGVTQAAKDLMLMQKLTANKDVSNQEVFAWISSDDFQFLDVKIEEWKLSLFVKHHLQLLTKRFSRETCGNSTKRQIEDLQLKWSNNPSLCFSCGCSESETFLDHPIFHKRICCSCLGEFKKDYFVPKVSGTMHPFSKSNHGVSVCFLCDKASLGVPVRSCWKENGQCVEKLDRGRTGHPTFYFKCRMYWPDNCHVSELFHPRLHHEIVASDTNPNILCLNTTYSTGEALCFCLKEAVGIGFFRLFFCGLPSTLTENSNSVDQHHNIEEALNCTVTHLSDIDQFGSLFPSMHVNYIISSTPGDGIGPYFFKFFKIVSIKKECNWFFQMQAPFNMDYVNLITRYLECPPGSLGHIDSSLNCSWTNEWSLLTKLQDLKIN